MQSAKVSSQQVGINLESYIYLGGRTGHLNSPGKPVETWSAKPSHRPTRLNLLKPNQAESQQNHPHSLRGALDSRVPRP